MKVRLPIIGQVQLGRAKEPEIKALEIPKTKAATLLGTFLDLGTKSLSTEKNISSKLISKALSIPLNCAPFVIMFFPPQPSEAAPFSVILRKSDFKA